MTPEQLAQQIEKRDFSYYLNAMLAKAPANVDKRQGSIIYDALAPAAMLMAQQSLSMAMLIRQTYIRTATDKFLDARAVEHGTSRQMATKAQAKAKFLDKKNQPISNVDIGDRYASLGDDPFFYRVVKINDDLTGILEAEDAGTKPNSYLGQVLPITPNDSLYWAEIIEVSVPARADETDDHLRERLLSQQNWIAYGGNIADYLDMLSKIITVGAGQVYPSWRGGGTVKLVILDNELRAASQELLTQVKNEIDPPDSPGLGYGLAPIDHTVTVVAPKEVHIDVSATVQVDVQETLDGLKLQIQEAIDGYFRQRREDWNNINPKTGRGYALVVYRSQILSAIMGVKGVVNATLPKLNGEDKDIAMTFTSELSQLPVLGEVIVSA